MVKGVTSVVICYKKFWKLLIDTRSSQDRPAKVDWDILGNHYETV